MKRSFVEALLTVTMIIMMSTAGYAFTSPHNYACDNCHGKFVGSPSNVASSNACLTCHSSNGEAPRMPVPTDAMSNYFGSASGQPATGSRSTHTWGAYSAPGHPYNPRAMVHEPTNTVLNTGYSPVTFYGTTLCNRCHDAKGDNANTKFLRVTNSNDALCLDCHRARNTSTHATGSHPVAYRAYSLVYKRNTTAFRKIPLSPNAYNPTAKLGTYLTVPNKGKIVCSTCHAPHYADSSSATLGNRSTANGFAQDDPAKGLKGTLQDSKGQLLRTDPFGATASSINVCSSCHKETANLNHNGRNQNIQCNHCHGAHVDYVGAAPPAGEKDPNSFLVRRDFSNMSTAKVKLGANVKVIYNTATSLRWKRADGRGVCQVCHVLPAGGTHDLANTRAQDCKDCHNHANGFSAGDCTTCHGQPPMTSTVGGPSGKASASYTIDESFTPHAVHADKAYYNYDCVNCHYAGTRSDSHNTTTPTFQSVFVETAGSVGDLAGRKNVPADYNTALRKCSNVYCHSNGSPRGGIAMKMYTTPSWEYGRNKIFNTATECSTCHESGATLTTNAHYKHVTTTGLGCNVCHAATASEANAIIDRTKHANGVKDIKFTTRPASFFGVFSSTWNSTAATCNNSCHTNGLGGAPVTKPKWTDSATGACGACHAAAPSSSLHSQHFTDPSGPNLGTSSAICSNCHDYNGGANKLHANGKVDLNAGNSCAPCHPGSAPIWMTGATVTCESCHTGTTLSTVNGYTAPANVRPNNTLGHGQYSSASLHVKCTSCHNAAAPHIRPAVAAKRLLVAGNALCNTCHIPSVMGIHSTARANLPVHGGTVNAFTTYTSSLNRANITALRADACAGCHDTHGTTNLMSVRTTINGKSVTFTNTSSGLVTQSTTGGFYTGLCQVCHTKTKYFRNNRAPENGHMNSNGKNCLSCHAHKGTFAFTPGSDGSCGGCHGYPPVRSMTGFGTSGNYLNAKLQDYSGGGGAHAKKGHVPLTAIEGDGMSKCNDCHYNTFTDNTHFKGPITPSKSFVNVVVDPKYKFNNASTIRYNAQTCSNVSCHFKKSPNWTNGL